MEEPSNATCEVAFGLFDRLGNLKTENMGYSVRRGNGAWGKEVNHGRFIFIESIHAEKNTARQAHGARMVKGK